MQTEPDSAIAYIDRLVDVLKSGLKDDHLSLHVNFSKETTADQSLASSMYRELAYCLEHSIHHKVLIKVGLIHSGYAYLVAEHFAWPPRPLDRKLVILNWPIQQNKIAMSHSIELTKPIKIAKFAELKEKEPAHGQVLGTDLVIIKYGKEVSVLYGRCLHRGALLSDGFIDGHNLDLWFTSLGLPL